MRYVKRPAILQLLMVVGFVLAAGAGSKFFVRPFAAKERRGRAHGLGRWRVVDRLWGERRRQVEIDSASCRQGLRLAGDRPQLEQRPENRRDDHSARLARGIARTLPRLLLLALGLF